MTNRQQEESQLPVLVNPPENKSAQSAKSQSDKDREANANKKNWLGTLLSKKSGTDFITSTSLNGIMSRNKRLLNTTALFIVVDVVLVSVFIFLWINR